MLPEYNIVYSEDANKDITKIRQYYLDNIDDGAYYFEKMFSKIFAHIDKLSTFPERGSVLGTYYGLPVRMIFWERFDIFFWINHDDLEVNILRIIDAHRHYRPF